MNTDQTGLALGNLSGALANASAGQVVDLQPSLRSGLPLGFMGVVQQNSSGTVNLAQAQISDVFTSLSVDYDSLRDGAQVVGLVSMPGGKATWTGTATPQQSGLDYVSCQLGLSISGELSCSKSGMNGDLSFSHKVSLQMKGDPSATTEAEIYGTVKISDLTATLKLDFDEKNTPPPTDSTK